MHFVNSADIRTNDLAIGGDPRCAGAMPSGRGSVSRSRQQIVPIICLMLVAGLVRPVPAKSRRGDAGESKSLGAV